MNDDLEPRLRDAFHRESLPTAPARLVDALERVPDAPVRARGGRGGRPVLALFAAAAVLVAAGVVAIAGGSKPGPAPSAQSATSQVPSAVASPGVAGSRFQYTALPVLGDPPTGADMTSIVSILQARLAATGIVGVTVEPQGADQIIVKLPGVTDPDPIRRWIAQTGRIDFVPLGDQGASKGDLIDLEVHKPMFSGDRIQSAIPGVDSAGNASLDLVLKPDAASLFADYTTANIGSYFAVVLDGTVLFAPVIQSSIPTGEVQISFATSEGPVPGEVAAIIALMNSGPLPFLLQETAFELVDLPQPSAP